jgi:hypothetical protein
MFFDGLESILESKEAHSHHHAGSAVEVMERIGDPFSLVRG